MMEKRNRPRHLTLKTAKITAEGIAAPIDCAVLNYSETGASLLVPRRCAIPRRFNLVLDPDGVVLACRMRWQSGNRIGISFDGIDAASAASEDARAAADGPEQGGSAAGPVEGGETHRGGSGDGGS